MYSSLSTGSVAWAKSKVKVRAHTLQMEWDQKGDWEGNHGGNLGIRRHSLSKLYLAQQIHWEPRKYIQFCKTKQLTCNFETQQSSQ